MAWIIPAPVYTVFPFTLDVQVVPERVTSPCANRVAVPESMDRTIPKNNLKNFFIKFSLDGKIQLFEYLVVFILFERNTIEKGRSKQKSDFFSVNLDGSIKVSFGNTMDTMEGKYEDPLKQILRWGALYSFFF